MHILNKKIFIGLIIILCGLMIQAENVHAIYSPRISKKVAEIKEHVLSARSVNGAGDLTSAITVLTELDDKNRAANTATGLPGQAVTAQGEVFEYVMTNIVTRPLDALFSIFNVLPSTGEVISNCLRDDIWTLEDMKDSVAQEMIKAYLMLDAYHGALLRDDYRYLVTHIDLLKDKGAHSGATVSVTTSDGSQKTMRIDEYLFGSTGAKNYYIYQFPDGACPDGDFVQAGEQVWNSLQTLGVMIKGGNVSWGSIWEMAKARAKIKAAAWIKANQITLTIAGEKGGNRISLLNDWDKFTGSVKTQMGILVNNVMGPVTPLFDWSLYKENTSVTESSCVYYYPDEHVFKPCTESQLEIFNKCEENSKEVTELDCNRFKNKDTKKQAVDWIKQHEKDAEQHQKTLEELKTTFVYNMNLNSVAEQSIYVLDTELFLINKQIQQGYEGVSSEAGKQIPTLLKKFETFDKSHCGGS